MLQKTTVKIRDAKATEADAIANLHTISWMSAYRGLLSDEYLDNNLLEERKKHWANKILVLTKEEFVLVAEQKGKLVGFVAVLDTPEAGFDVLVDNLHVVPELKRFGIGGQLLNAVADRLLRTGRKSFYLFVLKGNTAAEKFYLAKGGRAMDVITHEFGGKEVQAIRFGWDQLQNMK